MKLGLKLWSTNIHNYIEPAKELYKKGIYDYIELYVVPETVDNIKYWESLKIPFTLHAPHFMHGVNLAVKEQEKENIRIFKQVAKFKEALNAEYIVIHGGIEGDIKETARQLKLIIPFLFLGNHCLIENKPYIAPHADRKICRGAVIEEIKYIMDEAGCEFCLDIGHALCSANSFKFNPYDYLEEFNKLNPRCYHLSGNYIDNEIDSHLHLYEGNLELKRIFEIIDTGRNVAIETKKDSKTDLDDFVEDIKWLKNLI